MSKMLHTKALVEKSAIAETGIIDAIIGSSNVVDRMGDIIDQSGWDLSNYKQNPVILWGHNSSMAPIGKALRVWIEDKGKASAKLMFKVQMDLQDSFAADIFRKIKEGFINTVSVGFLPTEYEQIDPDNFWGGLKYLKQELLELSFVPVPANPQALVGMRALAEKDKRFTPVDIKTLFPEIKDKKSLEDIFKTKIEGEVPAETPADDKEETETPSTETGEPIEPETPAEEKPTETGTEPDKETPPVDDKPADDKPVVEPTPDDEKKITAEKVRGLLEGVQKAGRVLSGKNEGKIRQAVQLLEDVLSALDDDDEEEEPEEENKQAIEYKNLGSLPETESWDGVGELAKAQLPDVKEICTYVEAGKEEEKSAYKLPHHKAEGHKAVWRGVAACMATLMGAKGGAGIPKEYHKAIYEHLAEHYKEFGKTVPAYDMVERQALAGLDEELTALALEREEKHMVRLIKKILENQKQEKKIEKKQVVEPKITLEQQKKAFEIIEMALSIYQGKSMEGGAK